MTQQKQQQPTEMFHSVEKGTIVTDTIGKRQMFEMNRTINLIEQEELMKGWIFFDPMNFTCVIVKSQCYCVDFDEVYQTSVPQSATQIGQTTVGNNQKCNKFQFKPTTTRGETQTIVVAEDCVPVSREIESIDLQSGEPSLNSLMIFNGFKPLSKA